MDATCAPLTPPPSAREQNSTSILGPWQQQAPVCMRTPAMNSGAGDITSPHFPKEWWSSHKKVHHCIYEGIYSVKAWNPPDYCKPFFWSTYVYRCHASDFSRSCLDPAQPILWWRERFPGEAQDKAQLYLKQSASKTGTKAQNQVPCWQVKQQQRSPAPAFTVCDFNWSTPQCINNNLRKTKIYFIYFYKAFFCPHLHWLHMSDKGQNSLIYFCAGQKGRKKSQ